MHTPAPWKMDGGDIWHLGRGYNDKDDPHLFTGINVTSELDTETVKGNLRLIIAAPEMLEALEGLVEIAYEAMWRANDDQAGDYPSYDIEMELKKAREAVKKARGE